MLNNNNAGAALLPLVIVAGGLTAAGLAGSIGYGLYEGGSYLIDAPQREPIAVKIIDRSLQNCENADTDLVVYKNAFKDALLGTKSSILNDILDQDNLTLCVDPNLNKFTLPYDKVIKDEDGVARERALGEFRVTGVAIQDGDEEILIVKPESKERPATSNDTAPDYPHSISMVYNAYMKKPEDTYKVHVDGTNAYASFLLQQDGVVLFNKHSAPRNDDATLWADEMLSEGIGQHYTIQSP